ncbi:MAG: hypothetical protein ACREXR_04315 [Gammaproteobacteria bacterium]
MGDVKIAGGVSQDSNQLNAGNLEQRPQAGIAAGLDVSPTEAKHSPFAGAEIAASVAAATQTQSNTSTQYGYGGDAGSGEVDISQSGNNVF